MSWLKKISQNLFVNELSKIMQNVTSGDPQNQNQVWDGDMAVDQIHGLMQTNGDDVVCNELIQMLSGYAQFPVTRMIKNKCCGGYEMPQPESQQDPMQMSPMLPPTEQEKPLDMPSTNIG